MDDSDIPEIPYYLVCDACGETATVERRQAALGEQIVIIRMDDAFYIEINCPTCGRRRQLLAAKA